MRFDVTPITHQLGRKLGTCFRNDEFCHQHIKNAAFRFTAATLWQVMETLLGIRMEHWEICASQVKLLYNLAKKKLEWAFPLKWAKFLYWLVNAQQQKKLFICLPVMLSQTGKISAWNQSTWVIWGSQLKSRNREYRILEIKNKKIASANFGFQFC